MSNNPNPNLQSSQSEMRGIILTIEESGRIKSQMMGNLSEAEFLGLGVYLTNVLMKDGILALSKNQVVTVETLQQLISKVEEMKEAPKEEEQCGKESCLDCLHSEDSSQSSESSQVQLEE